MPVEMLEANAQQEVVKALENPEFVWRTVEGLVKDTSLPEDKIVTVLHHMSPDVLVTTLGRQGRLYTTREHYKKRQSFWGKFLSAMSGQLK